MSIHKIDGPYCFVLALSGNMSPKSYIGGAKIRKGRSDRSVQAEVMRCHVFRLLRTPQVKGDPNILGEQEMRGRTYLGKHVHHPKARFPNMIFSVFPELVLVSI